MLAYLLVLKRLWRFGRSQQVLAYLLQFAGMSAVTLANGVRFINKKQMLLVFPQNNQRDPPSLWYEFHPRTKMRWEWDDNGDTRVSDLWHLREKLSSSRKVMYTKWFRGRATVIGKDLFTVMLRALNPQWPEANGLSMAARDILDLLEEDSPLSTKQLKRAAGLVGRDAESAYNRALKELWDRLLIVDICAILFFTQKEVSFALKCIKKRQSL